MTTTADPKERQKRQWSAAAAAWDRRFDWYSRVFGPLMSWCCNAAALEPGMRVLDVASGSGQPAFRAAERVGRGGRVVGIDISPRMVELSSRRAAAEGIGWLEIREGDAERLPFADESFDAVTCACGLMLFPNAVGAVAEMRRVLKRGGRYAIAVWDEPSKSTFMTLAGSALATAFPPAPPDPNAPSGFRFSRPGALESVLREGGFTDPVVESLPMPIEFASTDEYWDVFVEMAAGIREKLGQLGEGDRRRIRAQVDESASPHVEDGRLRLVATPLCATGAKS